MQREHYLSFAALVHEDTVVLRRLYPEWGAQTRLPYFAHGTLLWYCTRHGCSRRRSTRTKSEQKTARRPREGTPLLRFWRHYAMPVTV